MSAATAGSTPSGSAIAAASGHDRRLGHRRDAAVGQDGRPARPVQCRGPVRQHVPERRGIGARPWPARHGTIGTPRTARATTAPPADRRATSERPAPPRRRRRRPRGPSRSASGAPIRRRERGGRNGRRPMPGSARGPRRRGAPRVRATPPRRPRRPPRGPPHGSRCSIFGRAPALPHPDAARTGRRPATTSRHRPRRPRHPASGRPRPGRPPRPRERP